MTLLSPRWSKLIPCLPTLIHSLSNCEGLGLKSDQLQRSRMQANPLRARRLATIGIVRPSLHSWPCVFHRCRTLLFAVIPWRRKKMFIRRFFVALIVLSAPVAVRAEESCAMQSVKMLAEGQSEQLAAMFIDKGQPAMAPALKSLSAQVGALSAIQQVNEPRFKQHKRLSVGRASGAYAGSWVNADSELLGAVQVHIAQSSAARCELLALHVDFSR